MDIEAKYQRQFYELVSDIMINSGMKELSAFGQTLGMVSTLIQDDRLADFLMVIRLHFPEYFTDYKPFRI